LWRVKSLRVRYYFIGRNTSTSIWLFRSLYWRWSLSLSRRLLIITISIADVVEFILHLLHQVRIIIISLSRFINYFLVQFVIERFFENFNDFRDLFSKKLSCLSFNSDFSCWLVVLIHGELLDFFFLSLKC
jgi:hypothetical protein